MGCVDDRATHWRAADREERSWRWYAPRHERRMAPRDNGRRKVHRQRRVIRRCGERNRTANRQIGPHIKRDLRREGTEAPIGGIRLNGEIVGPAALEPGDGL